MTGNTAPEEPNSTQYFGNTSNKQIQMNLTLALSDIHHAIMWVNYMVLLAGNTAYRGNKDNNWMF